MSTPHPQIESLESRQFLSAAPVPIGVIPIGTSKAAAMQDAAAAAYQAAVAKSIAIGKAHHLTASILGSWTGTVKLSKYFVTKSFDLTLDVTNVTPTKATGSVTIDGHTFTGTFKGTTKEEQFSYTFIKGNKSINLAGLLNGLNTAATGTVDAKYAGWSLKGTFSFTKVKPTTPAAT